MINLKEMFKIEKRRAEKKEKLLTSIQNETGYKQTQAQSKLRELNLKFYPNELEGFWDSAKNGTFKNNKQPNELSKDKLIIFAKSIGLDVNSKMIKKDILELINSKKGEELDGRQ